MDRKAKQQQDAEGDGVKSAKPTSTVQRIYSSWLEWRFDGWSVSTNGNRFNVYKGPYLRSIEDKEYGKKAR